MISAFRPLIIWDRTIPNNTTVYVSCEVHSWTMTLTWGSANTGMAECTVAARPDDDKPWSYFRFQWLGYTGQGHRKPWSTHADVALERNAPLWREGSRVCSRSLVVVLSVNLIRYMRRSYFEQPCYAHAFSLRLAQGRHTKPKPGYTWDWATNVASNLIFCLVLSLAFSL